MCAITNQCQLIENNREILRFTYNTWQSSIVLSCVGWFARRLKVGDLKERLEIGEKIACFS
jgi:hypothetical protein